MTHQHESVLQPRVQHPYRSQETLQRECFVRLMRERQLEVGRRLSDEGRCHFPRIQTDSEGERNNRCDGKCQRPSSYSCWARVESVASTRGPHRAVSRHRLSKVLPSPVGSRATNHPESRTACRTGAPSAKTSTPKPVIVHATSGPAGRSTMSDSARPAA